MPSAGIGNFTSDSKWRARWFREALCLAVRRLPQAGRRFWPHNRTHPVSASRSSMAATVLRVAAPARPVSEISRAATLSRVLAGEAGRPAALGPGRALQVDQAVAELRAINGEVRLRWWGKAPPSLFFAARDTPYSLFRPPIKRGDGAPGGASCSSSTASFEGVAPLGAPSRHLPYSAGPRFRGPFRLASGSKLAAPFGSTARLKPRASLHGPPSASSWQGSLVTPGGAPAPPGCRRSVRLLPAGAASCSII